MLNANYYEDLLQPHRQERGRPLLTHPGSMGFHKRSTLAHNMQRVDEI